MPKRAQPRSRQAAEPQAGAQPRKKRAAGKDPKAAARKSQGAARKSQVAARKSKVAARQRTDPTAASMHRKKVRARHTDPTNDRDARIAFFEEAQEYAPYLGIDVDGARFVLSTDDSSLSKGMFGKRGRPEFTVLSRAVTIIQILAGDDALADSLFLDVGANIGTTTVAALLWHGFGSAVAFEPEAENYRLLRTNLAINGMEDDVLTHQVGVSNRTGQSLIVGYPGGGSRAWLAEDLEMVRKAERPKSATGEDEEQEDDPKPQTTNTTTLEVDLVTLDGLVESGDIDKTRVGMVWIDAEGHEGHIFQGAAKLLEDGVPVVFEFNPVGLDERGDRSLINAVAQDSYTHFVDARRRDADRPRFELHPADQLDAYAEHAWEAHGKGFFTDVLLLRLDEDQATKGADLPRLVAARLEAAQSEDGTPKTFD
jgi:FkbM family methyltransferase